MVATRSDPDGGQDADEVKHRQISHGLAGVQRVGGRRLRQGTTNNESAEDPWLDDKAVRDSRKKNHIHAPDDDKDKEVPETGFKKVGSFLFPFTNSLGLAAQYRKCKITLCIGNTHVLKLLL